MKWLIAWLWDILPVLKKAGLCVCVCVFKCRATTPSLRHTSKSQMSPQKIVKWSYGRLAWIVTLSLVVEKKFSPVCGLYLSIFACFTFLSSTFRLRTCMLLVTFHWSYRFSFLPLNESLSSSWNSLCCFIHFLVSFFIFVTFFSPICNKFYKHWLMTQNKLVKTNVQCDLILTQC